jgi:polysaccharide export outer membrane protein
MFKKTILILFLIVISITGFVYCQDIEKEAEKHYQIGNFYYQQGRYKEANEEFQKALDLLSKRETVSAEQKAQVEEKEVVTEEKGARFEYVIGESDTLHISVWKNKDLDQDVIVRPDGKISFPLIGDVQAAGLSITQLDKEITERLREYIRYPEVSISIKKIGGKRVVVLGQVENPGVYSVTGTERILEAIGLAGGFTEDAVASSVVLIRGGYESPQAKRINLTRAINRGDMRLNVTLESEDVVFVPKKFIANVNYFLDQILDPIYKASTTARDVEMW